jgi:hypothetical protein
VLSSGRIYAGSATQWPHCSAPAANCNFKGQQQKPRQLPRATSLRGLHNDEYSGAAAAVLYEGANNP